MWARALSAALLIAATFCAASAAHAADHLTPCTDTLSDYYAQVETLMHQAAPDEALWKVTVFPPSRPEWSVRATRVGEGYELSVVRFDRSFWDSGWTWTKREGMRRDPSIAKARPHAITRKISARLFAELDARIRQSIAAARPNENILDDVVVDSTEFRFEAAGPTCGTVRTFDENGKIDGLVNIVLALCNPPGGEDTILRMLDALDTPKPSARLTR